MYIPEVFSGFMRQLSNLEEFLFENREPVPGDWTLEAVQRALEPHRGSLRVLCVVFAVKCENPQFEDEKGPDLSRVNLLSLDLRGFERLEELTVHYWDTGTNPDDVWRFLPPNLKRFSWQLYDSGIEYYPPEFRQVDADWLCALGAAAAAKQVPLTDISVTFGFDHDDEFNLSEMPLVSRLMPDLGVYGINIHFGVHNAGLKLIRKLFWFIDSDEDGGYEDGDRDDEGDEDVDYEDIFGF